MVRFLKSILLPTLIAGVCILALTYAFGWLLGPEISEEPELFDEEEAARITEERKVHIDLENPLRIHVEVDYSEGVAADWYPKGESPILRELVDEGKLPPVKERVGSEPFCSPHSHPLGRAWCRVQRNRARSFLQPGKAAFFCMDGRAVPILNRRCNGVLRN